MHVGLGHGAREQHTDGVEAEAQSLGDGLCLVTRRKLGHDLHLSGGEAEQLAQPILAGDHRLLGIGDRDQRQALARRTGFDVSGADQGRQRPAARGPRQRDRTRGVRAGLGRAGGLSDQPMKAPAGFGRRRAQADGGGMDAVAGPQQGLRRRIGVDDAALRIDQDHRARCALRKLRQRLPDASFDAEPKTELAGPSQRSLQNLRRCQLRLLEVRRSR